VALNPVNPIESASATATNGSPTISVTGGVDCSFIVPGFVLQLGTRRIVTAISGTAPVSGTSTITLAANWDQPTTTDKLIGWNSYESLPNIVNRIQNALANQTAIGELSTNGLVERTGANAFSTVAVTTFGKSLINAADAAAARTALSAQASDATLTAMAGVTTAANKIIYFTGVDAAAAADLSAYGRTLIAAADATAARTALSAQAADATLTALAGVTTAANKVIYFTGVDAAAAADLSAFGRSVIAGADAAAVNALLGVQSKATTELVAQLFQRATLDLNFATNRHNVYGAFGPELTALTTAITTARNSTATYQTPTGIGSAAINTPRITYDAATGNALGLLAEEQRTNLLLQSHVFDNASWIKQAGATIAPNTTTAPDGTLTADTLTTNNGVSLNQSATATVGATYCQSVYIKAGTITRLMVRDDTGAGRHIVVNPATGAVTSTSGTLVGHGVEAQQNGWLRVWLSYVADTAVVRMNIRSDAENAATVVLWGAQLEVGPAPTSYIPTTTAQVTRVGAFTTIANLAELASTLTEYTIIIQGKWIDDTVAFGFGNTFDNCIYISSKQFNLRSSGSAAPVLSLPHTTDTPVKIAVRVKSGDFAAAVNGAITGSSSSAIALPAGMVRATIGSAPWEGSATLANSANGTVSRITFIPRGLANAELQAVTA